MTVTRLTETGVAKLSPPSPGQRIELADALVTGLNLRITSNGVKSWSFLYRLGGKQQRMSLGHHPEVSLLKARTLVRELKQEVALGNDPIRMRKEKIIKQIKTEESGITIQNLSKDFIERHAKPNNRTWKATQQLLDNHVLPVLGNHVAKDVRRRDVVALLDKLAASNAPSAANHVLVALRKMYNWAIQRDILEYNPCTNIKLPVPIQERERVLNRDEIKKLWDAALEIGYPYGPVIQLLLLTGQRRSEIANLKWTHIDFEKGVISLPAENVKANRGHEVPLSSTALKILESLPRFDGPYIFSMTHGIKAIAGFGKTKPIIDKVFGVDDWRIHDLRRTCATGMAELGIPLPTISRVLNHAEGGVTRIYARYSFLSEKRQALNIWADHLRKIVSDKADHSNVIELRAKPETFI